MDEFSNTENFSEHPGGMIAWIDLIIYARNFPIFIDEKADSLRRLRARIAARPISECDFAVSIASEREFEIVLLREGSVAIDAVETDADDLDIVVVEIFLMVAKATTFEAASGRVGFGKKPQQNFLAAKTGKGKRCARMRLERELRRAIAYLQHKKVPGKVAAS